MLKVVLFTGGIIHDWQAVGDVLEPALAGEPDFEITRVDDDLDFFAGSSLEDFDVVVFYHTRGELADEVKNGLFDWVKAGGGFVGLHGATVSFKESPSWKAFIGGYFLGHPAPREYTVSVLDEEHDITQGLDEFRVFDEQYIMDYDPRVHVLATALYRGEAVPVAWTKNWGEGRIYYLALGHDAEAAGDENFTLLLKRGIRWAAKE